MKYGLLGSMFDLNGDGHLDALEHAAELMFIDSMERDRANDKIQSLGISHSGIEEMDEMERRNALEDMGIDPDILDQW